MTPQSDLIEPKGHFHWTGVFKNGVCIKCFNLGVQDERERTIQAVQEKLERDVVKSKK